MRIDPRRYSAAATVALVITLATSPSSFGQALQLEKIASHFAGNWVEDQSQRKLGAQPDLLFRKGASGLEEVRGPVTRPLVEPVRLGAAPYSFGEPNATMAWKQEGEGRFQRTMMDNGKSIEVRELTVGADGKTLTEVAKRSVNQGSALTTTTVYARTSGAGQTLEGDWKPQSVRSDPADTLSMRAVGKVLEVGTEAGLKYNLTLNGGPAVVTGPGVISGTTRTAKVLSDDVIQTSSERFGTPTSTGTWTLSKDGKTLTRSITPLGPGAGKDPMVYVYKKQ